MTPPGLSGNYSYAGADCRDVFSVNKGNDALAYVCEVRVQPATVPQEMDSALKEIRFRTAGVLLDQMPAAVSCNATCRSLIPPLHSGLRRS